MNLLKFYLKFIKILLKNKKMSKLCLGHSFLTIKNQIKPTDFLKI